MQTFLTTYTPKYRHKKPAVKNIITRSSSDWKKLVKEAKNKEIYWAKGILPGSIEVVNMTKYNTDD